MSLFKRLFKRKKTSEEKSVTPERGKFLPENPPPVDEKFTFNFNKNGGKFLYCTSTEEIMTAFDNILIENDWYEKEVFCINDQLKEKFNNYNLRFSNNPKATFFLSTCEALVATNGGVLLSSNQIKEKKLKELPFNFIIYATTSQLVDTISEGLQNIKIKFNNKIPSNITTIQDFKSSKKEENFMSYGSTTKNLYLLLLEDL